ncbi:MAG: 4Fe-4S dicluster domain-containing protein [Flavobacteriaceae bacterium]|jgi:ferredoxin|nr:4Fe-4S dicluster domain-containing protein [Flavobacteriaceae bacterium]NVJ73091.1 4Fe-4S dicluster domain-containing protein [Flavobacteriaceae bacterium]
MAIIITDECINCDACISECPNNAIYEPDSEWSYSDETALSGMVTVPGSGKEVDADESNEPISDEFYFIVSDKCTECKGFHDEPQCASVCPVDCCVPDDNHEESEDELLAKKAWLHGE